MKTYWSIPGASKAPDLPCIAFYKYDGSQFRAEWSKRRGWYKFGTRRQVIDESNELFGPAIPKFLDIYGKSLPLIFNNKKYKKFDSFTVYCEYFSQSSIGCYHDYEELHREGQIILFDVNINKKGFVFPSDFVKDFKDVPCASVIYKGNFNKQFIQNVWNEKYPLQEGIVAKGVNNQRLWMAKCKTKSWIERIKNIDQQIYQDNVKEQNG